MATSIEVVIRSVGATSAWADSFAKLSWAGTWSIEDRERTAAGPTGVLWEVKEARPVLNAIAVSTFPPVFTNS